MLFKINLVLYLLVFGMLGTNMCFSLSFKQPTPRSLKLLVFVTEVCDMISWKEFAQFISSPLTLSCPRGELTFLRPEKSSKGTHQGVSYRLPLPLTYRHYQIPLLCLLYLYVGINEILTDQFCHSCFANTPKLLYFAQMRRLTSKIND